MYRCVLLAVPLLFLGLAGSDDLYWRPNTDWSEPSNWDLGRVPIAGDVVDLSSVPRGSVIKLDNNTTVHKVILPVGSRIVLGRSVSLNLSPMVAEIKEDDKNVFVGTEPKYWECSENWEIDDSRAAKSAPCGKDRAFFREGHYYSSIVSNLSTVSVQYLYFKQDLVTNELLPKVAPELMLNLTIDPRCGEDPSLCPCYPMQCSTFTKPHSGSSDGTSSGIIAIVVVIIVIVLMIVTILLVMLWLKWRHRTRATPYTKDDLLGEPDDSLHSPTSQHASGGDGVLFDNPIYEMGVVKKNEGNSSEDQEATKMHEMATISILRPTSREYEPVDYKEEDTSTQQPQKKVPILDEYECLS